LSVKTPNRNPRTGNKKNGNNSTKQNKKKEASNLLANTCSPILCLFLAFFCNFFLMWTDEKLFFLITILWTSSKFQKNGKKCLFMSKNFFNKNQIMGLFTKSCQFFFWKNDEKQLKKLLSATFWANLCMNFDIFIYGEKILDKVFFSDQKSITIMW
jgi:hypothetical protein